jgi:hypothetical protein
MKNLPDSNYFKKSRIASKYKVAAPWVLGVAVPTQPTRMLSNVTVFDGWNCTTTAAFARKIVGTTPGLTLRDLQAAVLRGVEGGLLDNPYIWWVYEPKSRTRAIHEDAEGRSFIKLGKKWQLAYPLDAIAGLCGAQGCSEYENVPRSGYFIIWENEEIARSHSL